MPPFAYMRMMETIKNLRDTGGQEMSWLFVDADALEAVKGIFDSWLGPFKDKYSVEYAQSTLKCDDFHEGDITHRLCNPGGDHGTSGLGNKFEWEQHKRSLLVFPPRELMEEHEPVLAAILSGNCNRRLERLQAYPAKHGWRVNVTLLEPPQSGVP